MNRAALCRPALVERSALCRPCIVRRRPLALLALLCAASAGCQSALDQQTGLPKPGSEQFAEEVASDPFPTAGPAALFSP